MTLQLSPYSQEHLPHIVRNLREVDKYEAHKLCRRSAYRAIKESLDNSYKVITVIIDGTPVGLLGGLSPHGPVGTGVVWFTGTNETFKHKVQFLKQFIKAIGQLFDFHDELYNYIRKDNDNAYRFALRLKKIWPDDIEILDIGRIIKITIHSSIASKEK